MSSTSTTQPRLSSFSPQKVINRRHWCVHVLFLILLVLISKKSDLVATTMKHLNLELPYYTSAKGILSLLPTTHFSLSLSSLSLPLSTSPLLSVVLSPSLDLSLARTLSFSLSFSPSLSSLHPLIPDGTKSNLITHLAGSIKQFESLFHLAVTPSRRQTTRRRSPYISSLLVENHRLLFPLCFEVDTPLCCHLQYRRALVEIPAGRGHSSSSIFLFVSSLMNQVDLQLTWSDLNPVSFFSNKPSISAVDDVAELE